VPLCLCGESFYNQAVPRYHLVNFGCRANQADGAALEQQLTQRGFDRAARPEDADIVVLNSCTVTSAADYGVRQAARRVRRENPSARIVITGCYAQRRPEELAALPGVEYVVGNSHKGEIARLLSEECRATPQNAQFVPVELLSAPRGFEPLHSGSAVARILHADIFVHQEMAASTVLEGVAGGKPHERTRPNLKIQDGCNNRCSFCVIPYVRGRSRSLPFREVITQVRSLSEAGYQEVVLSGINLGRYGRDFGERKLHLAPLIQALLDETPIARLRLSSVEPMDFTNELLDLMARSPRIAKHVHAPLQSGSDRILRLMHRKYRPGHYRDRIEAAFARMPNAAFGADVMVGFPGEMDGDFEETRSLIDSLPFTYLHVFPFSRRPGTPADKIPGQVNGAVIRERARVLRELGAQKNRRFRERQLRGVLEVVTLGGEAPGSAAWNAALGGTIALSDNFLDVFIPGERWPGNRLLRVRIAGISEEGLVAEPVSGRTDQVPTGPAEEAPSQIFLPSSLSIRTCASA
jgi:threonylcarbamoyladenosine tRNA methylthiotransferase MtaB